MTEHKLLPCPFCGCDEAEFDANQRGGVWIECGNCGASTLMRNNFYRDCRPLLMEAWNRRSPSAESDQGTASGPEAPSDAKDAARYRWLRDKSTDRDSFYMSVPKYLHGVRFTRETVDEAIDAALAATQPPSSTGEAA